ncbi:MAG: hypothetical protein DWQ36_25330 [Acidobacteria bacterium]|nr:MAG: hypothetical protein DWQ30_25345 [Acidobacteriota bacterium]REJ99481.1 MAG: hypothetical protein DWQ36_25330 [Acidobacteriota bacterium]
MQLVAAGEGLFLHSGTAGAWWIPWEKLEAHAWREVTEGITLDGVPLERSGESEEASRGR